MKRLLLVGGGHAHVHVLKTLIDAPITNTHVTLLTPYAHQVYSGMLPGWIAGHYRLDQCKIALAPLAARAGVQMIAASLTALDPAAQVVTTSTGETLRYDVISIDTGSVANTLGIPGAAEHAITIRPIDEFIHKIDARVIENLALPADAAPTRWTIVGGGAGGVEVALALKHRLGARAIVTIISAANTLPAAVGARVARALAQANVIVHRDTGAARITQDSVVLADGSPIASQHVIAALGAAPATWHRRAGLDLDDRGYIAVNASLQSTSHPNVFAAGDCATMQNTPRPKSGVYAVRAGPPLAENIRRALEGAPLHTHTPQKRALYLIATGSKYAIGSWGNWSWEGAWVWRWKDRIDRAFMQRYGVADAASSHAENA